MAASQGLSSLGKDHPLYDIPAVSLPNGIIWFYNFISSQNILKGCNSLPIDLIPKLEIFEKIYLWLDNDKSGIRSHLSYYYYHYYQLYCHLQVKMLALSS